MHLFNASSLLLHKMKGIRSWSMRLSICHTLPSYYYKEGIGLSRHNLMRNNLTD